MDELWLQLSQDAGTGLSGHLLVDSHGINRPKRLFDHFLRQLAKLQRIWTWRQNKDGTAIEFRPSCVVSHLGIYMDIHGTNPVQRTSPPSVWGSAQQTARPTAAH